MCRVFFLLFLTALICPASAVSWTGGVSNTSDGSSWSIQRQSGTIGFDLSSSVEGEISPITVTPSGRIAYQYYTHYANIEVNDVRLKERTAAIEGVYSSENLIMLRAEAEVDVNMTAFKPNNSDVWTITFEENWPVILNASRSIDYVGQGINDRDCVGNNLDKAISSFLYNKEFSKERTAGLVLERMNVTVIATNETIIRADFMPTKSLDYEVQSHTTGIADFRYRQTGLNGSEVNYGEERYLGTYDITRKIGMESDYSQEVDESNWLACCIGGCSDVELACDHIWVESGVFDCVCS